MAAENFQKREILERLEQARRTKAPQGGYAGYGSPAFGQQSIDGSADCFRLRQDDRLHQTNLMHLILIVFNVFTFGAASRLSF